MDQKRRQLAAERPRVVLAQVDLIRRAAEPEPHRLIRRAPVKIVFQHDGYLRCHPGLLDCDGLSAPYRPADRLRQPQRANRHDRTRQPAGAIFIVVSQWDPRLA
jgi:hypothetical protein